MKTILIIGIPLLIVTNSYLMFTNLANHNYLMAAIAFTCVLININTAKDVT